VYGGMTEGCSEPRNIQ